MKWLVFLAFLGIGFFVIAHAQYVPIMERVRKGSYPVKSVVETDKKKKRVLHLYFRTEKHPQERVVAT